MFVFAFGDEAKEVKTPTICDQDTTAWVHMHDKAAKDVIKVKSDVESSTAVICFILLVAQREQDVKVFIFGSQIEHDALFKGKLTD
ncbi:hypothetical protein Tco_0286879 [Tanacetum coccineum]